MTPLSIRSGHGVFLIGAPALFPAASNRHAQNPLTVGRLLADPEAQAQLRRHFDSLHLGHHDRHHFTPSELREVLDRAITRGRLRILWLPAAVTMHAPMLQVARATAAAAKPLAPPPLVIAGGAAPPPKPVVPAVANMPDTPLGKVEAALKKSLDHVGPELKRALDGFNTVEVLQDIATFCLLIMAAQAAGVGAAAIDLVLLAYAYSLAGWAGLQAGYEFIGATIDATQAKLPADIDRAGKRYAGAFIKLGEAFAAWLLARLQRRTMGSAKSTEEPVDRTSSSDSKAPSKELETTSSRISSEQPASASRPPQKPSGSRWAKPDTLVDHYERHGSDFQAKSPSDYADKAGRFLDEARAKGLPTKVDGNGVIRVYDSATNTFGSYGSDGLAKTFFKPTSPTYWERQPGTLQ